MKKLPRRENEGSIIGMNREDINIGRNRRRTRRKKRSGRWKRRKIGRSRSGSQRIMPKRCIINTGRRRDGRKVNTERRKLIQRRSSVGQRGRSVTTGRRRR